MEVGWSPNFADKLEGLDLARIIGWLFASDLEL